MTYRNINYVNSQTITDPSYQKLHQLSKEVYKSPAATSRYEAPGGVEDLNSKTLIELWNGRIEEEYKELSDFHSRFFDLNYESIPGGKDISDVRWTSSPAEPEFCFDEKTAQELCDWRLDTGHPIHSALSAKGRRRTHNEYCEYRIVFKEDDDEKIRPKRVIFTTELREYWMTLATYSPEQLASACSDAIGRTPTWSELYGPGVTDPLVLHPKDRLLLFATWVSGGGGDSDLMRAGVPTYPIGALNNENALFMTHRINGLDDLFYIVLYGAHPYARNEKGIWVKATKDEIFSQTHFGEDEAPVHLACRHADPAAALGAAGQAFEGRQIGFSNPLGMYFMTFAKDDFLFDNNPLPDNWIKFSRGKGAKFFQRLEFGPPDDVPHFLDEITVGDENETLKGGYQIAQRIEVGPWLRVGEPSSVSDAEYSSFHVEKVPEYKCANAEVCKNHRRLKDEYEQNRDSEI